MTSLRPRSERLCVTRAQWRLLAEIAKPDGEERSWPESVRVPVAAEALMRLGFVRPGDETRPFVITEHGMAALRKHEGRLAWKALESHPLDWLGVPRCIAASISLDEESGCWEWLGNVGQSGYGLAYFQGQQRSTHRVLFKLFHGRWPLDGMQIDHLCRNRKCCCPMHLEEVTAQENIRRSSVSQVRRARAAQRTHFRCGHPATPDNLYLRTETDQGVERKRRGCLTCQKRKQAGRLFGSQREELLHLRKLRDLATAVVDAQNVDLEEMHWRISELAAHIRNGGTNG